jgi:xanthine dehydrogenase accessory factor
MRGAVDASTVGAAGDPCLEGKGVVLNRDLLDRLLDARRRQQPAAHLRWLDSGRERLIRGDDLGTLGDDDRLAPIVRAALRDDRGATIDTDEGRLFVQPFNPPLRLIVVGAVHIAQTLVPMARLAGYDVTLVDPRRSFADERRFPEVAISHDWPDEALEALRPNARTAVVTLTHDPKLDDPALDVALRSDAFYIAALGSRRTHAARLERLQALGHDQATLARIHGPAGLALGAVSPAEIALSVMAEMTSVLRGADRA